MIETDIYRGLVLDGEHILNTKAPYSLDCVVSITFYSDEYVTPVLPLAGSCSFTASEDGFNYGTIAHGDLEFPIARYNRPYFYGFARYLKANMLGITGATNFEMRLHSVKEVS